MNLEVAESRYTRIFSIFNRRAGGGKEAAGLAGAGVEGAAEGFG